MQLDLFRAHCNLQREEELDELMKIIVVSRPDFDFSYSEHEPPGLALIYRQLRIQLVEWREADIETSTKEVTAFSLLKVPPTTPPKLKSHVSWNATTVYILAF